MANIYWLNVTEAKGVAVEGNERMISNKDQTGILTSIRKATEEEINTSTKPRSIPDPWARAYLFGIYVLRKEKEKRLSDVQEKQQARIIGSWRGFLAMLALQQVYDINVEVKKVNACEGIGESLWRNLPETEERDRIDPDLNDSEAVNLFYVNGLAAGMTNAAFGALPGYCQNRFDASYPWSDGMEYIDPSGSLTRGERMILFAWLEHVRDFYTKNEKTPAVIEPLDAYLNDLKLKHSDKALARQAKAHILPGHMLKEGPLQPLEERIALNALDISETRIDGSDFCLVDSPEHIEPDKEQLVIGLLDELMYARGSKLFKKFLPEGQKRTPISATEMFLDTCYWFGTERIENDDLAIDNSAMYIHASNKVVQGKVHLFPMKSAYADKLKDVVEGGFEISVANGFVRAGVRFMVNEKPRVITCAFSPEAQDELDFARMATTVVWPNVPGCRAYHVGTQWSKYAGNVNTFVMLPLNAEANLAKDKLRTRYIVEGFPRFLKAQWVDAEQAKAMECGIAMLRDLKQSEAVMEKVNYALDFGTSASIAAYNTGNPEDSKKVDFDNQTILITPNEREVDMANKILFGAHAVIAPFPTIYYLDPFPTAILFQGGHPYFEQPNKLIDQTEKKQHMASNIKFDFGTGGDMTFIQRDYIKGIIYMLIVHARKMGAKQMTLNLSYPISIKEPQLFQDKILEIVENYEKGKSGDGSDAYPFVVELSSSNVDFVTESEAATRFFCSKYTPKEYITLDIGGGSADFFTYSNKNNGRAMVASVVAGSRIFLLDLLRRRPSIFVEAMRAIRKKYNDTSLEKRWFEKVAYTESEEYAFYSDVECLLQYNIITEDGATHNVGNDIEDIFLYRAGQLAKEENAHIIKQMKTIWLFQLAAFFYYAGMMYKCSIGKETPLEKTTINFFLSGRGSQILNWLPPESTEKVLIEMARKAMGVKADVVISLMHEKHTKKTESAIGMLKDAIKSKTKAIKKDDFTFDFVVGEAYIDTKKERRDGMSLLRHRCSLGREGLNSQSLGKDFDHIDPKFPILTSFITALNENISNSGLHDVVYRIDLCDTPGQAVNAKKSTSSLLLVDKETLATLMQDMKRSIDNSKADDNVPLFFSLINKIRGKAIEEWVGKE